MWTFICFNNNSHSSAHQELHPKWARTFCTVPWPSVMRAVKVLTIFTSPVIFRKYPTAMTWREHNQCARWHLEQKYLWTLKFSSSPAGKWVACRNSADGFHVTVWRVFWSLEMCTWETTREKSQMEKECLHDLKHVKINVHGSCRSIFSIYWIRTYSERVSVLHTWKAAANETDQRLPSRGRGSYGTETCWGSGGY